MGTTTVTRARVDLRSRRTQLVLVLVAVLAVVILVIELGSHSQTSSARVKAALVALTPILPNLDSHQAVIISHPSCDAYPPCTSAARTWSLPIGSPTFDELDRALPVWASRNHLHGTTRQWDCGPTDGLFGASGPGCQAWFTRPESNQGVFVAVTFTDQSAVTFDPAKVGYNGLPNPLSVLGDHSVASLSVQVVGSKR